MQMISAIIQPFMIDRLARALRKNGYSGYAAYHVKESSKALADSPDFFDDRIKVEFAVEDVMVDKVVELILQTVGTHQEGDGLIFVMPISQVINIENNRRGTNAISS